MLFRQIIDKLLTLFDQAFVDDTIIDLVWFVGPKDTNVAQDQGPRAAFVIEGPCNKSYAVRIPVDNCFVIPFNTDGSII